jgi:hypothetical protein
MSGAKEKEEKLERLKLDNEVAAEEASLAQKKKIIREARRKYGPDWKKVLGVAKHIKINSETLHDLHSMGIDGGHLRELNNPFKNR